MSDTLESPRPQQGPYSEKEADRNNYRQTSRVWRATLLKMAARGVPFGATLAAAVLLWGARPAEPPAPPADFTRSVVFSSGITAPVSMEFLPDGRMLVAERGGVVRWASPPYTALESDTFMTVPNVWVNVERSVQTIVHDPAFPADPFIYVYYTHLIDGRNRVSRFTVSGNTADPASEFIVWRDSVSSASTHQGGGLTFGHGDTLFITVGDGRAQASAQDSTTFKGKILRKLKDGSVPANNPGVIDGLPQTPGDLFAHGLRNPWRAWFDAAANRLLLCDVGPGVGSWEEINVGVADADYGWPNCTGSTGCPSGVETPIYEYQRSANLGAAVTGGFVYRGTRFPPDYRNSYFFGDQREEWIRRLRLNASGDVIDMQFFEPPNSTVGSNDVGSIVDLEEGPDGALYWVDLFGYVRKITYTGAILTLDSKVLLEGPYAGSGRMTDNLLPPTIPPFADALYDGSLVGLDNPYYIDPVPEGVVDYVVVSLRSSTNGATEVAGSRLPAFIDTTGQILNLDGSAPFVFPGLSDGSYYLVVAQSNHLAVMSDTLIAFSAGAGAHDFTGGAAYLSDGTAMKLLGDGFWGMYAGNGSPDLDVQALDFDQVLEQVLAGATGYRSADYNLDGTVDDSDIALYLANTLVGARSTVP